MARLRCVRALNARTRVREQVRLRGSRRNPLEGAVSPRARQNPLEGAVSPRARRNPLEGEVSPRARRNLLEGAFDWAAPWAAGATAAWVVPCVRVQVGGAFCFCFLQVLSRIPPVF
jgi:hypothetical protein